MVRISKKKRRTFDREADGYMWLGIGEIAKRIGRNKQQVSRWVAWWELTSEDVHKLVPVPLPAFRRDLDGYGSRYFREVDLQEIRKFRDQIDYGFFSRYDAEAWKVAKTLKSTIKEGDSDGIGTTDPQP